MGRKPPRGKLCGATGANFLVSIHYQENHSWQGEIQWLDTGKKVHFRSELELMNLICKAVQSSNNHVVDFRTWEEEVKLELV